MHWRAVDDVIGIGTDEAVGDAVKDSIVDSDKFKRVLAEDGVDAGSKTLGLAYVDVPSLVNLASAFGGFDGRERQGSARQSQARRRRALLDAGATAIR